MMREKILPKRRKRAARSDDGGGGQGKFDTFAPLSERPDNCTTVFCGNLPYDITDDALRSFADGCGEILKIRWLSDKHTQQFKGCAYVDFDTDKAVDAFVLKNGHEIMGRKIRIDYG